MVAMANPLESPSKADNSQKQTVEFRCPDGSADIYLLMAGLCVAARHGFEMKNALQLAEDTYVNINIHKSENKEKMESLNQLPTSCWESAEALQANRAIYENHEVFPHQLIDDLIKQLKSFNDEHILQELEKNPHLMMELVNRYFHCG